MSNKKDDSEAMEEEMDMPEMEKDPEMSADPDGAGDLDINMEDVAEANLEKLRNRMKNDTLSGSGDDR